MKRFVFALVALGVACAAPRTPTPSTPVFSPAPAAKAPVEASTDWKGMLVRLDAVPALDEARARLAAAAGRVEQAGRPPNPIAQTWIQGIETDTPGEGPGRYRVQLRQRLETAGKRARRTELAGAERAGAEAGLRIVRFALARDAARETLAARFAGEAARLRREAHARAVELADLRRKLVAEGRARPDTLPGLQAAAGEALESALRDEQRRTTALRRLEGLLALPPGSLGKSPPALGAPRADAGEADTAANPELAGLDAERGRARSAVAHARARRAPDVTVGLSYEDEQIADRFRERTFGMFFELPLPLFDRNRGNVRAAEADLARVEAARRTLELHLVARAAELRARLDALEARLDGFDAVILPARAEAARAARAAFAAGRADRTNVAEAELALLRSRIDALALREARDLARVELLAVLGRPPGTWFSASP